MKTEPIVPARIEFAAGHAPCAPDFGDVYHAEAGALEQARHVFLAGNGLPARWGGRQRFVILETGFGLGNNFLASWATWRGASEAERCERLVFVSIEKHPATREDLARAHAVSPLRELAQQLIAAWPPATPNLHSLSFEQGRVQLLLAFGDVAALLPEIQAEVDAFYLDGFSPALNPQMWQPRVIKRIGRLAAPAATAATWSAAGAVRSALVEAGFEVERVPGFAGKRDMTIARYAPRHAPQRAAAALRTPGGPREALVVGAGLAGCAAAWALSRQGWRCRVFEREGEPATANSGQAGGLMHGTFQGDDGLHARWFRAAALRAERVARPWVEGGRVAGQLRGALRLEQRLDEAGASAQLAASGLPRNYVQWLAREAASELCGFTLPSGAWFYPGGGWLAPRELARAFLAEGEASLETNYDVAALKRAGEDWQLLDAAGRVLAQAPVVVLANAGTAHALALSACGERPAELWPQQAIRGQTTLLPADTPGLRAPLLPVAGAGYVLPAHRGLVLCGATSQADDREASLRAEDHRHNLERLGALSGSQPQIDEHQLEKLAGRVGWRIATPDKLPLIGAVPDLAAAQAAARLDQARFVPRLTGSRGGLYVFTALASRGLTSAALGAELLASWVSGSPCPVEADLRDALDPARFLVRTWRKAQS